MPKKLEHSTPEPRTLQEAILYFSDEDNCLAYLVARRWPDGVTCPICGSKEVIFLANQRRWKCRVKHERQQFSVKVGTVMEDSPIPLTKWLPAMWMIGNCKNGISSYEIARDLDVTQKTAWFMLHRVRLAMHDTEPGMLSGTVEADETFVGGLARNMHKSRKEKTITGTGGSGKTAVMGLLERHTSEKGKEKVVDSLDYDPKKDKKASRVKAMVVPNVQRRTLHGEIEKHVAPGSEVHTDEWTGYKGLDPVYVHNVINHAEQYVRGAVHTNGIENFWALLKRMIKGSYVSVEPFHLFCYVDEEAFRFNERKLTDSERLHNVASSLAGRCLTYKSLTGKDSIQEPLPA